MAIERVTFEVGGEQVVGELHLPENGAPFGAAVLLGPLTSVKEQATRSYARALAERGWAALSFDPRTFGESGGQPRQYESPPAKVEDVRGAVQFLASRPEVDPARIVAVGICAGGGYMAGAVAAEPQIRAFGAVAGFFHDAAMQRQWMGEEQLQAQLERARAARERFEATGEVESIPAVGAPGEEVAMPLAEAFDYYGTERGAIGGYVNRFAVMSREHTLPWDAQEAAARITVPTVMVHSDKALAPALARSFYDRLAGPKQIHWVESEGQIDFYDDPARVEPAADHLDQAFRAALA